MPKRKIKRDYLETEWDLGNINYIIDTVFKNYPAYSKKERRERFRDDITNSIIQWR